MRVVTYILFLCAFINLDCNAFICKPVPKCIIDTKTVFIKRNQIHRANKNKHPIKSVLFMNDDVEDQLFTQKQILKEETEAPFRKVRIFFYISLLSAAGLGTVICLTKILAFTLQSRPSADLTDLYTNLGINLAGIPVLGYLWKNDLEKQKVLLDRIQKGGSLAGLKIKLLTPAGSLTVKLSDLRRDRGIDKRVVIVVAERESVLNSLQTSIARSLEMLQNDLVIVPLVIESDPNNDYILSAPTLEGLYLPEGTAGSLEDNLEHIGIPVALAGWNNVVRKEISTALTQDTNALKKGFINTDYIHAYTACTVYIFLHLIHTVRA